MPIHILQINDTHSDRKKYEHTTINEVLPSEQKGVPRKATGCKDHLMLDILMRKGVSSPIKSISNEVSSKEIHSHHSSPAYA